MGLALLGLGSSVSHEGGQHRVKDGRAETLGPMGHMEGDQAQRLLRSWPSPEGIGHKSRSGGARLSVPWAPSLPPPRPPYLSGASAPSASERGVEGGKEGHSVRLTWAL